MSDKTIWTPLWPDVKDGEEKWCDGTAFKHPNNTKEASTGGGKDAEPITLEAYNQIIDTYNVIAKEADRSERDKWLEEDSLSVEEVEKFKKDINEWRYPDFEWSITPGDEDYLCEDDINDLRRMAAYPDLKHEQDIHSEFPAFLAYYCYDKVTDGMRIYIETEAGSASGWQNYVDTKIAPEGQSHRFWLWTQYFDYGYWRSTTVGIIGIDGKMKPPFGSYDLYENWLESPQVGMGIGTNWHLIQLTQDIHTPLDALNTVTKLLKGHVFMLAESYSWSKTVVVTCSDHKFHQVTTITHTSSCSPTPYTRVYTTEYITSDGYWCNYVCLTGGSCTVFFSGSGSQPAADWDIEFGDTNIHTWEYYMDTL